MLGVYSPPRTGGESAKMGGNTPPFRMGVGGSFLPQNSPPDRGGVWVEIWGVGGEWGSGTFGEIWNAPPRSGGSFGSEWGRSGESGGSLPAAGENFLGCFSQFSKGKRSFLGSKIFWPPKAARKFWVEFGQSGGEWGRENLGPRSGITPPRTGGE